MRVSWPREGVPGQPASPSLCLGPQGQGGPVCGHRSHLPDRGHRGGVQGLCPGPRAVVDAGARPPVCPVPACSVPGRLSALRHGPARSEARPGLRRALPGAAGFSGLCSSPVGEGDEREAPQWPFRVAGFPAPPSPLSLRLLPSVSQPALPQEAGAEGPGAGAAGARAERMLILGACGQCRPHWAHTVALQSPPHGCGQRHPRASALGWLWSERGHGGRCRPYNLGPGGTLPGLLPLLLPLPLPLLRAFPGGGG